MQNFQWLYESVPGLWDTLFKYVDPNIVETTSEKQNNGLKLVFDVNKWASISNIHAELRILTLTHHVEVFKANMINKFLLNQNHVLH